MLPIFPHTAGGMLASMVFLALLLIGTLWPILLVYAVRRFLRDFTRIADALEGRAARQQPEERPVFAITPEQSREARDRISLSAFGR